jgi:hypothetical protein
MPEEKEEKKETEKPERSDVFPEGAVTYWKPKGSNRVMTSDEYREWKKKQKEEREARDKRFVEAQEEDDRRKREIYLKRRREAVEKDNAE